MPKDTSPVKIVKVGQVAAAAPAPISAGARRKTMKTYPRGVLKRKGGATIKAVQDPTKSPPLKSNKGTLRILTEKGASKRRKTIKQTVRAMPDRKVRDVLRKNGMPVSEKTPTELAKEILEGGMEAGMIVVK
jgi:hypothetical protein